MKDEIRAKLDEHIKYLLNKPALTNEDYAVLREKFSELPTKTGTGMDWAWPMLMMMIFGVLGNRNSD